MKKIIASLLFLVGFSVIAQENKIETGLYSSTSPSTEGIKLILEKDQKFHISVISGTYEQVNDSIYFHPQGENDPQFQLEYVTSTAKTNKIKINFGTRTFLSFYNVYFGTQKINETEIDYQTLESRLNISNNNFDYDEKEYSFEIDRAAFIYLVTEEFDKETIVEKYEVPENVVEVKIAKKNSIFGKLKLIGYLNPKTKEFIVSEGNKPIAFTKTNNSNGEYAFIKPIESLSKKNWTYPGKPADDVYFPSSDSTTVDYDYTYDKPHYVFKLQTEKSLYDALKVAQKSPTKLLAIFYDTSKTAEADFKKYIENYETNVGYLMYEKYNPEYDNVNFYLATEADKNALKKMGVNEASSIVFLNSDGTKLYHCKGKMTDYDFSEYGLTYLIKELKAIDALAKTDAAFSNKKTTVDTVEKVFLAITQSEKSFVSEVIDTVIPPPAPPKVEFETTKEVDYETVDTAVAVIEPYNYSMFKEKQNVYQFKTTQDVVNQKYKQLLDAHLKDATVNTDLVQIILAELDYYSGFSHKLFNKAAEKLSVSDFQSIDYLLKFFNEIPKFQPDDYSVNYSNEYLINTVIVALSRESNATQLPKISEYYSKLAKVTNNNPKVLRNLIFALKTNGTPVEYLSAYESYFNSVLPNPTNIVEQLDNAYGLGQEMSWIEFKSAFANDANDAAWFVVEKLKNTNTSILNKAITWSETSLVIEKNNHYYLDTLAQLYYLNGDKQKGIQYEQKAIDAALVSSDSSTLEDYRTVLEKMKNGTY
ncbi:MAG: hypothetical protein JNJ52_01970 [Flavobacterium sp.]|nr:hypothetical protein [Flavobacterium sp.]